MRNKNTMRVKKYISDHLFWLITAMIWYRGSLFTAIPGMTVKQSKIILWISALVLVALGCVITMKKRRNGLSHSPMSSSHMSCTQSFPIARIFPNWFGVRYCLPAFCRLPLSSLACFQRRTANITVQRDGNVKSFTAYSEQNDNRRLHFGFDCANRYQQGVRAGTDDHKSAARFQCI